MVEYDFDGCSEQMTKNVDMVYASTDPMLNGPTVINAIKTVAITSSAIVSMLCEIGKLQQHILKQLKRVDNP